jgi:hypothetical protein
MARVGCLGLLVVLTWSGSAAADEEEELAEPARDFGRQGQVAISSDFVLSMTVTRTVLPGGESPGAVSELSLGPALDYFVADSWSLGARVAYTRTSFEETHTTDVSVGPRVGYDLALGAIVSLWPRLSLVYRATDITGTTIDPVTGETANTDFQGGALSARGDLPLLLHPVRHFFLGLGAFVSVDVLSRLDGEEGARRTDLGVASFVGGWF